MSKSTPKTTPPAKKKSSSQPPKPIGDWITWFEIPAYDFERATAFYKRLFGVDMEISEVNNYKMALFPSDGGISGAIICGEGSTPNDTGPLIYLQALGGLDKILPIIDEAGGRVLLPKTLISESAGSFAIFMDTEGNKLALHEK